MVLKKSSLLAITSVVFCSCAQVQAESLTHTAFDATYRNVLLDSTVRILYDGERYVRTINTYGGKMKGLMRDNQNFFDLKLKTAVLVTSVPSPRSTDLPFSHFSMLKQLFLDWKQTPPVANAKPLGTREINGKQCHGWEVQLACPMEIWADDQTGAVVREVDHAAAGNVVTEQLNYTVKKYGVEAYTGRPAK